MRVSRLPPFNPLADILLETGNNKLVNQNKPSVRFANRLISQFN